MIRIFSQYISPKSILLMIMEAILIVLALLCGVKLRFWNDPLEFEVYTMLPDFGAQALVIVVAFQTCFYYTDLYDLGAVHHRAEQLTRLAQAIGAACLILSLLYFMVPALLIGRGVFVISVGLVIVAIMLGRVAVDGAWHATAPPAKALILGSGQLALFVARELLDRTDLNVQLLGFVTTAGGSGSPKPGASLLGHPVFDSSELESLTQQHRAARIIVALEDRRGALPTRELVSLRVQGVRVEEAHSALAGLTGRVCLDAIRPSWFVFSGGFRRSKATAALKRATDLGLGLVGLLLSLPVMAVVALAVRLESRGPILYRQVRVGLADRCFELLKFRSMRTDAEQGTGAQWAQENDPRVTRIGAFLRKYRFDELPQFLNVIRGEMSFIGPRPERPVFVEDLRMRIPYYDERHSVRPGITGWAQVQYGYGATVEDAFRKLEYDLFYLQNMSLLFDCAIVFKTLRIVLFGRGAR